MKFESYFDPHTINMLTTWMCANFRQSKSKLLIYTLKMYLKANIFYNATYFCSYKSRSFDLIEWYIFIIVFKSKFGEIGMWTNQHQFNGQNCLIVCFASTKYGFLGEYETKEWMVSALSWWWIEWFCVIMLINEGTIVVSIIHKVNC